MASIRIATLTSAVTTHPVVSSAFFWGKPLTVMSQGVRMLTVANTVNINPITMISPGIP